ncbi:hypothetical protein ACS0TY_031977 [Phlomoides rotata]
MAELEKSGGAEAAVVEEEERLLGKEATALDFDMLCATVALQSQQGKWGKLNEENGDVPNYIQSGGGVHRMWEGELVYDFFDDRRLALQSTCFPCYRFGKNMKRAGFGSCFLQGYFYLILVAVSLCNLLAFAITRRFYYIYLAISSFLFLGTYLGYYRIQIKKKFNIKGGESSLDDFVYHLICPCFTLSQESRTLELNNVQDGIWHGRGDTICIQSFSNDDSKAYLKSSPAFVVSTKSSELVSMQKPLNDVVPLVGKSSSPLIPPPE